ncbi:hypothetical protein K438DRAFT_1999852 [Mycena galopus ATCC 62051]|nr:hypothetical protein K438DRAFT_1999852 [Mycena galopus ATCC 62051]
MNFASYSTPPPGASFSLASLGTITFAQAASLVRDKALPHILPKDSLRRWVFEATVPIAVAEVTLSAGEAIPCAEDMHQITDLMESAYNNLGARLDSHNGRPPHHPLIIFYRVSSTDVWSVIPAFPENSAPIPRARPPQLRKSKDPLLISTGANPSKKSKPKAASVLKLKPTPIEQSGSSEREHSLLSYIIQYTQDFTIGPLDYCGIACRIKGRGSCTAMVTRGCPSFTIDNLN